MSRKYTVAIAGTGYVGLSNAILLAQHNRVFALDIIPEKVNMINNKISPIADREIEEFLRDAELDLTATTDPAQAYTEADFVIISTPTNYDEVKNYFDTSSVESAIENGTLTVVTTTASAVAAYLAQQVARVGLFFLSFILIVVIWWLFSHMVDLAFHLPVLRTLNEAGGLAFGLIEGAILLVVLCWALVTFDVVPAATAAQTRLFSLFLRFQII